MSSIWHFGSDGSEILNIIIQDKFLIIHLHQSCFKTSVTLFLPIILSPQGHFDVCQTGNVSHDENKSILSLFQLASKLLRDAIVRQRSDYVLHLTIFLILTCYKCLESQLEPCALIQNLLLCVIYMRSCFTMLNTVGSCNGVDQAAARVTSSSYIKHCPLNKFNVAKNTILC